MHADVALDVLALRKRVLRFVEKELDVLPVFTDLCRFAAGFGPMTIFGGLIRDLALGYSRDFSSDIDVVVKGMPANVLERVLGPYGARRNKFGGFRVQIGRWGLDLWNFERTWAFENGLIEGHELQDLLRTTFFNWDAVLFELERREIYSAPDYFADLAERSLNINLRQTPNEFGAAVRTLRLMSTDDAVLSPELAAFLYEQILTFGIHAIVREDAKRTSGRRLTESFVGSAAIALREHQTCRPGSDFALFSFQAELPLSERGVAG
jgi:hypothetical protein